MISIAFYHADGTVNIRKPYNAQFVDDLQYEVPPSYRLWDKPSRTWRVAPPYDPATLSILRRYFPFAEVEERPRRQTFTIHQAHACNCDADHKVLYVCQDAPLDVVKAAFKALAKVNHPDRGGDHVVMQRLNEAVERIESGARS
jgi:hypothetical protein